MNLALMLRCLLSLLIPVATVLGESDCSSASTCSECIGTSESCVWCSDTNFRGSRCSDVNQISANCTSQLSENPRGRVVNLTHVQHSPMNQFTPVSAQLELRVGEPQSFRVDVTPSANYPLDLYILMDLSFSMTRYLDNLRGVALSLADALGNVTSQFRIGFGAFNEKLIRPFTMSDINPRVSFPPFRTDFTFRHVVSLTNDTEGYREGIAPLVTVTNDDGPEALLDGLLQATVCTSLIGWREESRKLILAFTDQHYHSAGDGRVAGIVRPHDGNCYVERLNSTRQFDYTMSRVLDYPSIGMVRAKLQENDIIPIFASVTEQEQTYLELARFIPGAVFQSIGNREAMASDLDPALILQIIEASYNLTSQRVELIPITNSPHLQFSVEATCPMYEQYVSTQWNPQLYFVPTAL